MPKRTARAEIAFSLATFASEAGVILDRLQKSGCASRSKADGSPVSEADLQSEALIAARLAAAYPDIPVISEEKTQEFAIDPQKPFFLVDPLDGTRAFLAGLPEYCILIALIEKGAPVLGAIHAPATGATWWGGNKVHASADRGFSQIRTIAPRPERPDGQIAIISRESARESSEALCEHLNVSEIRLENSALKFVRMLEGEADLYPRAGRTMQWDIAAGDALLRLLGGGVFDLSGNPLCYGQGEQGWANPDFIALRAQPHLDDAF